MASYTLNTSVDQEALLTWIVQTYNTEHDTTLTNAQYVAFRFPTLLQPFAAQFRAHQLDDLKTRYSAADAPTQQQVKTLLGLT